MSPGPSSSPGGSPIQNANPISLSEERVYAISLFTDPTKIGPFSAGWKSWSVDKEYLRTKCSADSIMAGEILSGVRRFLTVKKLTGSDYKLKQVYGEGEITLSLEPYPHPTYSTIFKHVVSKKECTIVESIDLASTFVDCAQCTTSDGSSTVYISFSDVTSDYDAVKNAEFVGQLISGCSCCVILLAFAGFAGMFK